MTTPLVLAALVVTVLARCAVLSMGTVLAPPDIELLGAQPFRVVDAFRWTGPDPNLALADDLFTAMSNGERVESSPAAMLLHGLLGSGSIVLRIAPLATLQTAAALCEIVAAGLIAVAFGHLRPFYTVGAMACIAILPAQSVDDAMLMAIYAIILALMTYEPLPPSGVVFGALSVGLTAFNPFACGLLVAVALWCHKGSLLCRCATGAAIVCGLAVFDVSKNVRVSLFDMHPHQGNAWLMYQLLFARFQHAFNVVSLGLCFMTTAVVASAVRDRGTYVMPVQVAAVAVTAKLIFQPVSTLADLLIALAFLGATPQVYRIRYGFLALGTIVVTTPLTMAYRYAWLQLGSMPQPNMAFYGGSVHQIAVSLLLGQYVTRIVGEARAARELRVTATQEAPT